MRAKGRSGDLLGEAVPNHRRTVEMVRAMRRRYAEGESIKSIARAYGISRGAASDIIHGRAWAHIEGAHPVGPRRVRREPLDPARRARGSKVPSAKLDEETVRLIRVRHATGASCRTLAQEYGLSLAKMSLVLQRKSWAHVD